MNLIITPLKPDRSYPALNTPEGQQVRNTTGDQVEAIKAANPNAHDGSATPKDKIKAWQEQNQALIEEQSTSLEIYDEVKQEVVAARVMSELTKPVVSRNEASEKPSETIEELTRETKAALSYLSVVALSERTHLISANPEFAKESIERTPTDKPPVVWYHEPVLQAQKIKHQIDELMKHHKLSPYAVEAPPAGFPKCNLFLYDIMDKAGVQLPHGEHGHRLTVANLDRALGNDPNFEKVWHRKPNESVWRDERTRFRNSFTAQDGDIAIWNNRYLEHTCLLEETIDGKGNTYYAGRDTPSGVGYFPLGTWWVDSPVQGYGAPDSIYRYKRFVR